MEHIGVYEIRDRPRGLDVIGEPENHYLGLTYPDGRRKLAFHTIKRLVDLLDVGTLTVADSALDVQVTVGLARPGSSSTEYALDGSAEPYPDLNGAELRGVRLEPGEVRLFAIEPGANPRPAQGTDRQGN